MLKRGGGSSDGSFGMGLGETYKVMAAVNLSTVKLDPPVQDAFVSMSDNFTKLTNMVEKIEKPVQVLIYCVGASFLLFSVSSFIRSLAYAWNTPKSITKD